MYRMWAPICTVAMGPTVVGGVSLGSWFKIMSSRNSMCIFIRMKAHCISKQNIFTYSIHLLIHLTNIKLHAKDKGNH